MSLHSLLVGQGRPDVMFLHGLLGQGRNWLGIAKSLQDAVTSLLVDLPDHGRSPWTDSFGYAAMADAIADDISERMGSAASLAVVGHSLGGKVAMQLALRHPHLVRALVVVDIAPDDSSHGYGFGRLLRSMRHLDLATLTSRSDADQRLRPAVPDAVVRGFLLQNLHRSGGTFHWQPNLDLLLEALPAISGWPATRGIYDGPVLQLRGGESEYVRDEHAEPMRALFPRVRLVTVPGAGHWVHSEAPDAVVSELRRFLTDCGIARG